MVVRRVVGMGTLPPPAPGSGEVVWTYAPGGEWVLQAGSPRGGGGHRIDGELWG